jgi:hypothetical protein
MVDGIPRDKDKVVMMMDSKNDHPQGGVHLRGLKGTMTEEMMVDGVLKGGKRTEDQRTRDLKAEVRTIEVGMTEGQMATVMMMGRTEVKTAGLK